MSKQQSTSQRVIERLVEASDLDIDPAEVGPQTALREDLDISSLQALTLIMDLEDEFGITVEDEEFESLTTVAQVIELLDSKA